MINNEQQNELLEYFRSEYEKATVESYKKHYREMMMLIENGRAIADGKTIVLDKQMFENLWFLYQTHKKLTAKTEI